MKPDYIIFPDASQRKTDEIKITAFGCVFLNYEQKEYGYIREELCDKSIVFAEAYAIYKGLITAGKRHKSSSILVVTDSKLNVSILSKYIPYVWNTTDWYHWKKRSGEDVKNQDIYRKILQVIDEYDLKVKFVHINSHQSTNDTEKIRKKLESFHMKADSTTIKTMIEMNGLADKLATDLTWKRKIAENCYVSLKWKS